MNKTTAGGTLTTKGFIPNMTHPRGKFQMPVKCKQMKSGIVTARARPPVIKEGFLVFALPGGGEYRSDHTLETAHLIR